MPCTDAGRCVAEIEADLPFSICVLRPRHKHFRHRSASRWLRNPKGALAMRAELAVASRPSFNSGHPPVSRLRHSISPETSLLAAAPPQPATKPHQRPPAPAPAPAPAVGDGSKPVPSRSEFSRSLGRSRSGDVSLDETLTRSERKLNATLARSEAHLAAALAAAADQKPARHCRAPRRPRAGLNGSVAPATPPAAAGPGAEPRSSLQQKLSKCQARRRLLCQRAARMAMRCTHPLHI